MRRTTACACWERTITANVWPGSVKSSPKVPAPVTNRWSSRRRGERPMPQSFILMLPDVKGHAFKMIAQDGLQEAFPQAAIALQVAGIPLRAKNSENATLARLGQHPDVFQRMERQILGPPFTTLYRADGNTRNWKQLRQVLGIVPGVELL